MIESRGELDLPQEALGAEAGREIRMQHLDRDSAIVLAVLGEVHGRHAAAAELAIDRVGLRQCVPQAVDWKCGNRRHLSIPRCVPKILPAIKRAGIGVPAHHDRANQAAGRLARPLHIACSNARYRGSCLSESRSLSCSIQPLSPQPRLTACSSASRASSPAADALRRCRRRCRAGLDRRVGPNGAFQIRRARASGSKCATLARGKDAGPRVVRIQLQVLLHQLRCPCAAPQSASSVTTKRSSAPGR